MSRLRSIVALTVCILWITSPAALAEDESRYLTNFYQEDPTDWNDPWRDSTVGPRNNLTEIDGHVGQGVRVTIDAGEHFGAAMRWRFADNSFAEPEQLWFRYYLRFPLGFANIGKGKLPGPAGLYSASARGNRPSSIAEPGWSARMLFSPTNDERDADHTRIGYYLYHLEQSNDHGDLLLWEDDVATLQHGQWYCIEGYVQMNTPGAGDGLLRGWVDGAEAFSMDSLQLRRATEPQVRIDSFWFDVYFGGRAPASSGLSFDFDSLAFGQDRLGCDDSAEKGFDGNFFDDEGSVHEKDIDALRTAGVIHGCNTNGDAFCPEAGLTRAQMAKLLVRALQLPTTDSDYFTDDDGSMYESDINAIAALGITNGCGPGAYCPDSVMTRAQVAAFVSRALGLPDSEQDHFGDDAASIFHREVNALADAGITFGCADGLFCPDVDVSRSQAASFVARAMELTALTQPSVDEDPPEGRIRPRSTPIPFY